MLRAIPVPRIEADLYPNAIADLRARRLAHVTVQIQIKTPVPDRHHVDPPRHRGLAVDAHENRKRFAPTGFDGFCLGGSDEDVRVGVGVADSYDWCKAENCHRYAVKTKRVGLVVSNNLQPTRPGTSNFWQACPGHSPAHPASVSPPERHLRGWAGLVPVPLVASERVGRKPMRRDSSRPQHIQLQQRYPALPSCRVRGLPRKSRQGWNR